MPPANACWPCLDLADAPSGNGQRLRLQATSALVEWVAAAGQRLRPRPGVLPRRGRHQRLARTQLAKAGGTGVRASVQSHRRCAIAAGSAGADNRTTAGQPAHLRRTTGAEHCRPCADLPTIARSSTGDPATPRPTAGRPRGTTGGRGVPGKNNGVVCQHSCGAGLWRGLPAAGTGSSGATPTGHAGQRGSQAVAG